ncbi:DUF1648 domain-containing protein [Streptomyces profundus]|uniref:DUF1648 domain-containing protein n=1 Tax=Streptomyces profundus TaxID=2867410 RepID=UPI001D162491|nr:DUF1648 domain-containing protein [Streptomyces sp. MA3_2.13]UED87053.1 DUF1648 domain-containing protein [Streptomyces sp. MA3_2.13]
MSRARDIGLVAVPFAVASTAYLITAIRLYDRLPDRVATHFDGSGTADGFVSRDLAVIGGLATLVLTGLVMVLSVRLGRFAPPRPLVAVGAAVATVTGVLLTRTLIVNADLTDPAAAETPLWWLPLIFGLAALVGWGAWLLAGRGGASNEGAPWADAAETPVPAMPLRDGENAVWSRSVGSRALVAGAVLAALAGVVPLAMGDWGPGFVVSMVAVLVIAVLVGACAAARVTVSERGVLVDLPLLPRPRVSVPMERVVDASVRQVRPVADFGGWGYRVRAGASGLVLRSGEALSVRLADGRAFVVTVDDAETAAALLNGLAERRRGGAV